MSSYDFAVTNANEIELQLNVVMTLEEWKALKEEMTTNWPAHTFRNNISEMIRYAEARFYPKED